MNLDKIIPNFTIFIRTRWFNPMRRVKNNGKYLGKNPHFAIIKVVTNYMINLDLLEWKMCSGTRKCSRLWRTWIFKKIWIGRYRSNRGTYWNRHSSWTNARKVYTFTWAMSPKSILYFLNIIFNEQRIIIICIYSNLCTYYYMIQGPCMV